MLLCISDGAELSPVLDYCQSINLFCDAVDVSEYEDIKTALSKNRAMGNYQYILFYFPDTVDMGGLGAEILEAVQHIRRYYHARMIVMARECRETARLFGELFDLELRELVSVTAETDLAAELGECLSPEGKGFAASILHQFTAKVETAAAYLRPDVAIPDGYCLTIGIGGSEPRVGVTTQAVSMYHALAALGFRPLLLDWSRSFSESLRALCGDEVDGDDGVLTFRGVSIGTESPPTGGYNALLYDFGELHDRNIEAYRACDLRLLCTGAKPWELERFLDKELQYGEAIDRLIVSFASEQEQAELARIGLPYPISYAPWNPNIWQHTNREWHEQLLIPALKERLPS